MDAANILKPAVVQGRASDHRSHYCGGVPGSTSRRMRLWSCRFQPITVEEPTEEETIEILKGIRKSYEKHHQVEITDEALEAAAKLSKRYISDRFLPDKAIDLMDEAAARVRLGDNQTVHAAAELERESGELLEELEAAIRNQDFCAGGESSCGAPDRRREA